MEAAVVTSTAAPSPQRRRLPLARILFAIAAVAVLATAGGYAVRFVSAAAFHQERAFRVLDEVGAQLDNLQRTLTHQLNLMSDLLAGVECVKALDAAERSALETPEAKACKARQGAYERRLALRGPRVALAHVDEDLHARACGGASPSAKQYAFVVGAHRPAAPFTAFSCDSAATRSPELKQRNMVAFTGELTGTLEKFVSQSFFDEVLIALEDGAVVASAGLRPERGVAVANAQRGRKLGMIDASGMLARAEKELGGQPKEDESELLSQPAAFTDRVAGERYRVFVKLHTPAYEIYREANGDGKAVRQGRLYLIGLKRDDVRAQVAGSIEPAGRFGLMVLVTLALLAWPLANLRAKAVEEAISWPEAIACLISIVLIPAVLAVTAVWVWSYHGIRSWADAGARTYANDVATVLTAELERGRRVLTQFRPVFEQDRGAATSAPLRVNPGATARGEGKAYIEAPVAACSSEGDRTCTLDSAALGGADVFKAWSPFVSVFATNEEGRRTGSRYTVYDAPSVKPDFNYSAREYFSELRQGRGWARPGEREVYFAQRIFSGGDGARVLQLAVPRECDRGFCGVITGSLSVHSLSSAVAPPLMRFAVIHQHTGQVLFHSDDARSLAENFFVETEHNARLRALVQIGQSDAFSGYYMGATHRFYHMPVRGAPWSVVAFYSLREAGDLSWHAILTALAAYCGAMLVILAASGLALWVWFKRSEQGVRNLAARFWHRIGFACSYQRWGVSLFGGAAALVAVYEIVVDLRAGGPVAVSSITWMMCGVALVAGLLLHFQHRRDNHGLCIASWLLLVSAAPAAWIAIGHHDVQVRGLLRDGLVAASSEVMQRQEAIASDLHRWLSNDDARIKHFPDPWLLAQPSATMPVPGYTAAACRKEAKALPSVWTTCVYDAPPLGSLIRKRELDFWRRETWSAAAQDAVQHRRIELLGETQASNPRCGSTDEYEECRFETPDGRRIALRIGVHDRRSSALALERADIDSSADEARFDLVLGAALKLGAFAIVLGAAWALALFASRRLLGVRGAGCGAALDAWPLQHSTVFHTRGLDRSAIDEILAAARPHGAEAASKIDVLRVNLAGEASLAQLAEQMKPPQEARSPYAPRRAVLLTNFDIALADAARRREILAVLERLAEDRQTPLLLHARRSPLERLYHPERFPECGPEHAPTLDEALRWDSVFQKLDLIEIVEPERPMRRPHLADVDHHRTWKLCTRAERLLLHQLATRQLANPRNHAVIDALVHRGLVARNPWPEIIDPGFEEYVRTAETAAELARWRHEATQSAGKRLRTTLITVALIVLLIAVIWFNWTASDQFKIVSTVLAASVAFLSQMGQAFNFVKGGPKN